MTTTSVMLARGLTKSFGSFQALDGLDLEVAEGEVHGFLGPNGAGKSTTIRVLLGLYRPSAGEVRLFGESPWQRPAELHRRLAYVPGDVDLWPSLTGGEAIDLLIRLRGGSPRASDRQRLIEAFEFDPTKRIRTYSKGNRQKVALIAAFALPCDLYILDEPTSGLDPLMEAVFQDCVNAAKDRGRTVLLSSHILSEVEALCQRVTIIRAGRTVETGTLESMRHLSRTSITAEMVGDPGDLRRIPGVEDVSVDGSTLHCQVESHALGELIRVLGDAGVRSLVSAPPTLEELFLRHYETEKVPV